MPFYVFAWIASFFFGLVAIIGKLTGKYSISNPWLFNFLWALFSLILTVPSALINHAGLPSHVSSIIIVSFFNAIFNILYIVSLVHLDVSTFTPLLNLRVAFVSIIGAFFLNEALVPYKYILVALILIGGIFVSIDEKFSFKSFFKIYIFLAFLCTLSYTLMGVFSKSAIAANGYWRFTLWMPIISQLFLLITLPLFIKDLPKVKIKQLSVVFLMSLSLAVGILTESRAYKENVVITNIITALPFSVIMAFLFSIFAPKLLEKHTLKVYAIRFTAAAIMIISALKLSL